MAEKWLEKANIMIMSMETSGLSDIDSGPASGSGITYSFTKDENVQESLSNIGSEDGQGNTGDDHDEVLSHQSLPKSHVRPMKKSHKKYRQLSQSETEHWKRGVAKTKRNCGEEYVSRSGKIVPAKTFIDKDCLCKTKCIELITTEDRERIFKRYWNFSAESKLVYVCGHVQQIDIANHKSTTGEIPKRQKSCNYFLPKRDNSMVRVCKSYFKDTLQISNGALGRALKRENDMDFTDRRGKKVPGNKKSQVELQSIIDHINSYPTTKAGTSTKSKVSYLPEQLNLKMMYRSYKDTCTLPMPLKPVSETTYKKIFYQNFKLKFKKTCKEVCTKCERSTVAKVEDQKPSDCLVPIMPKMESMVAIHSHSSLIPHTHTIPHTHRIPHTHSQPVPGVPLPPQAPPQPPQQISEYTHNPIPMNDNSHNNMVTSVPTSMQYYRNGMWMHATDQLL